MLGIGLLLCVSLVAGGSLVMTIFATLKYGARWTGNFWQDVFPFIITFAIAALAGFGALRLVRALRKRAS